MSSQLGISGTSYRLQLGLINKRWASRLLKGKDVLDSYVYKDVELGDGDFPNQNYIVGWVLRTVAIPNINPHQIMKTTQALIKQAIQKKQEKRAVAPVVETKKVELEKIPESEIKGTFKGPGWVKQEGEKTQEEILEEQRSAFKERVAAERAKEAQASTSSTVRSRRQLPTIPGATPQETPAVAAVSAEKISEKKSAEVSAEEVSEKPSEFCPYCGKELPKFCPHCGRELPHEH